MCWDPRFAMTTRPFVGLATVRSVLLTAGHGARVGPAIRCWLSIHFADDLFQLAERYWLLTRSSELSQACRLRSFSVCMSAL